MSKKILLIHSSVDGHTVKILDKISSLIGEKRSVTKKCISEVSKDLIKQSDSLVIIFKSFLLSTSQWQD